MAKSQRRSKRKVSGGRYKNTRNKRLFELGRDPTLTKLGPKKTKTLRVRGGDAKKIILTIDQVNVYDSKKKIKKKVKIKNVIENKANRNYARRNILTKGTIIDTELGKARITSRPGQVPVLNAVLI